MNYAELTTAVQDYLETSEATFVANIPLFVRAVENRVYSEVRLPSLRKNSEGSLNAGDKYVSMPDDFISVYSFAIIDPDTDEHAYLMLKDVNLIREVYPNAASTGVPKFYGLFEEKALILGPTPAKSYNTELHYSYFPESMVTAGTSWLADNFEAVVLYGVIAEGYRFLKGDATQQKIYDEQYMNALGLLARTVGQRIHIDRYTYKQPSQSGD